MTLPETGMGRREGGEWRKEEGWEGRRGRAGRGGGRKDEEEQKGVTVEHGQAAMGN